jgi:hypothetical protein
VGTVLYVGIFCVDIAREWTSVMKKRSVSAPPRRYGRHQASEKTHAREIRREAKVAEKTTNLQLGPLPSAAARERTAAAVVATTSPAMPSPGAAAATPPATSPPAKRRKTVVARRSVGPSIVAIKEDDGRANRCQCRNNHRCHLYFIRHLSCRRLFA